jgi:glycine/D-amino acid oxidase-like deaminating enzyme
MSCSGRSVWQAKAPARAPNPPLIGDRRADVVVVGGGFSGLSTAWHVKQIDPSASVVVIEAREVGCGASGRAAGNCFRLFGESLEIVRLVHGR